MKLKNFWLFQSCLSKLNTIALGVGSQFSSVKLRESKQQQAARTYTQGPTGFHKFFSIFFTNSCISWCETLRAILFFYSLTLMPSLAFFQSRRFNNLAEKVDEKMGVESLRATLCRSRRSPTHNWSKNFMKEPYFLKTKFSPYLKNFHRIIVQQLKTILKHKLNNTKALSKTILTHVGSPTTQSWLCKKRLTCLSE